jgi:hypothetical protein
MGRHRPLHYAKHFWALRLFLVRRRLSVAEPLVFARITDPKPDQSTFDLNCQTAILQSNTSRSKSSDLFEV